MTVPGSTIGGNNLRSSLQISSTRSDQSRRAKSNIPELDPSEGSVTNCPDSFVKTQSPIMPTCAISAKTSGSCRAIQRNRAGAVIATQSPARS